MGAEQSLGGLLGDWAIPLSCLNSDFRGTLGSSFTMLQGRSVTHVHSVFAYIRSCARFASRVTGGPVAGCGQGGSPWCEHVWSDAHEYC